MIVKSKHFDNFAKVSNEVLRNKTLSLKAKGMFAILCSLPPDWVVHKTQLWQFSTGGRDEAMRAFEELINIGLVLKVGRIRQSGQFKEFDYIVYPEPQLSPITENPTLDNPTQVFPTQVNPQLTKKDKTKKDLTKKETTKKEVKLSKRKFFDFFGYDIDKTLTAVERKKNLHGAVGRAFSRIHKHIEDLDDLNERVNSFVKFYSEPANSDKDLMKFEEIQTRSGFDLDQRLYDWVMKFKTSEDYHDEYINNL
jgi:hypothetical protein